MKSFLGRGWAFPPQFNKNSNEVEMVDQDIDIRQSLLILLSTDPGERIMNPTFGCSIRSLVFETIDESLKTMIKEAIRKAIVFFEPRIDIESIKIITDKQHLGFIAIQIEYTIRMTNTRSNMVYPFYFKEGTLIVD